MKFRKKFQNHHLFYQFIFFKIIPASFYQISLTQVDLVCFNLNIR